MFNSIEVYRDNGRKAGRAMRNHDMGLLNHLSDWQRRAERLENDADRKAAREAYNAGYAEYRRS